MSVELLDIYAEYYDTDMDYIINGRKNNNNEVIKILENYPLQKQKMAKQKKYMIYLLLQHIMITERD